MLTIPLFVLTSKTAYFVIPENVKHGEELICSYFACRNAGIKFRYCSHCKVPVAKRNFRKRHKHGGEIAGDKDDDSGDDDTPKKGIPSQITASREEEVDEDDISSQSGDSTNHQEESKKDSELCESHVTGPMLTVETNKAKAVEPEEDALVNLTISAERQARWISLLAKRPSTKDSDTMSGWLMEVLAVSDLETPLPTLNNETVKAPETNENALSDDEKSIVEVEAELVHENLVVQKQEDLVLNEKANGLKGEHPMGELNGGILKKKRQVDMFETDELRANETKNNSEAELPFVSGSFAEWKERKKQKMQSKGINNSPGNSGVSSQSQSTA
jgi:hypothetical protein